MAIMSIQTKPELVDYTDDILDYLASIKTKTVDTMVMIKDMTVRAKNRTESRRLRGQLLSNLSILIRAKKVIRYRRATMVRRKPSSSQGLLRLSLAFPPRKVQCQK